MKLLLLLGVLLFAVWLWRSARTGERPQQPPEAAPPPDTSAMVQCLHCQVHLPAEEAVLGVCGPYCGTAHRSAAGDTSPRP